MLSMPESRSTSLTLVEPPWPEWQLLLGLGLGFKKRLAFVFADDDVNDDEDEDDNDDDNDVVGGAILGVGVGGSITLLVVVSCGGLGLTCGRELGL